MAPELLKVSPIRLKSAGVDERWLQDRIGEDPSILGLGDLAVVRRERNQPTRGRIDFLMADTEETRYEVEIMLGSLDESHIIRTIEYWDIERQRYPSLDHRAVIVAEEITSRFFNVIRLLNRSVPIIAVQLNAFQIDGRIVLHFTKVLDILEEVVEDAEDTASDRSDRKVWESRSNPESISIMDTVLAILNSINPSLKTTYNSGHIAAGTDGYNFAWFRPLKSGNCHVTIRPRTSGQELAVQRLEAAGITTIVKRHYVMFNLSRKDTDAAADVLRQVLAACEEASRGAYREPNSEAA